MGFYHFYIYTFNVWPLDAKPFALKWTLNPRKSRSKVSHFRHRHLCSPAEELTRCSGWEVRWQRSGLIFAGKLCGNIRRHFLDRDFDWFVDLTLFPDVFVNPNLLHQVSASLQGTSLATSCFGHPPERRSASNLGRESGARRSRICERVCAVQGRIAMLRSCARTKGANSDELCSSLSQLGTSSAAGSQCSKQHLGRLGERCQLCHSLRRPRGQDGESDGRRKQLAERRELRGRRRSSFSTSKEADRKEQSRKFYQTRQQKRERRAWPKIQEPVSFLGPKGQGRKEGEWRHGSASEPCASEQRRHRNSGIVRNFENIEEVAEERPRQILQPQLRGKLFKQQGPTSQAHRDCQGISKLSEGQKGTATEATTTCEKVPSGDRGFLGVRRVHTLPIGRLHKEVELGKDAHLAAVPSHDQRGASAAASGQGRRDSFATGTEPTSNVSMQLGRRKLDLSLASHLPSRSSGETAVWRRCRSWSQPIFHACFPGGVHGWH